MADVVAIGRKDLLDLTPQDAKRLCEYGKATAEQLALVLARAPRRAA